MGWLQDHAVWLLLMAVLGAAIVGLLLARKRADRDVFTSQWPTRRSEPILDQSMAPVGRHRADTPEAPLHSGEPVVVGAHVKTVSAASDH